MTKTLDGAFVRELEKRAEEEMTPARAEKVRRAVRELQKERQVTREVLDRRMMSKRF